MARRDIHDAVVDPHDARERFDPDFVLLCQCQACSEVWQSPRRLIQDSTRDHFESCPAKHLSADRGSAAVRVFYPKQ